MNTRAGSPGSRQLLDRILAAGFAATVLLSGVAPAQAAPPGKREPGITTYLPLPTPGGEIKLCPGQTQQVAVRLRKWVTRTVGGPVVGRPKDVPQARISATSLNPSVATVDPPVGQAAQLQFSGPAAGRPPHFGAWFTVTGITPGDTGIKFVGLGFRNPNDPSSDINYLGGKTPDNTSVVRVECQFKVTLNAAWTIPGADLTHDASFILQDVVLAPDADGNFQVDATVPNRVARGGSAVCPGSSTVNSSAAHFNGSVTLDGVLHVNVTFDAVPTSGSEGCMGQTHKGTARPDPLSFTQDVSSGARRFFFQLPHILQEESGSLSGQTLVYIDVLAP